MKVIVSFLLCLMVVDAWSQQPIPTFFDSKWNVVSSRENATYYRFTEYTDSAFSAGTEKSFYISGKPYAVETFTSFYPLSREGVARSWYENGQLKTEKLYRENRLDSTFSEWYPNGQKKMEIPYKGGEIHGTLQTWYDNGQLKRKDEYDKGKLVKGSCFNADGSNRFYESFEKDPDITSLMRFVSGKLKYPKASKKAKTEGEVLMYFVLDEAGKVTQLRVIKGVNEEINAEALRVMRLAPGQKPGIVDGSPYPYAFVIPIRFQVR